MRAGETVLIIDDDASIREALSGLVRSVGLRAETFATPQEFLLSPRPEAATCVVLDVRLPGSSGLDLQRELVSAGDRTPIVFITGYADVPMSVRAMKAGATEFLTKPFRDQELLDAIEQALEKDRVTRQSRAEREDLRRRYRTLTHREQEVMALVVKGKPNKQTADALGITETTVKVHRRHLMRKMGTRSLVDLARMAEKLA
jgi:FixJ family two-component response regulator